VDSTVRTELATITSTLEELAQRLSTLVDGAERDVTSELYVELVGAERTVTSLLRRLSRATSRFP
jgi:hypothetical protein